MKEIDENEDFKDIDLDDYMGLIKDESDADGNEDNESEKEDEDIGDVGGKLKKSGPFLVGGLLTIIVIVAIVCVIAVFAGKKNDGGQADTAGASANNISASAQPSGNDVLYINVSSNNSETVADKESETETDMDMETETAPEAYAYVTESDDESLTVADVTTSNTLAVSSREFLETEDYPEIIELIGDYIDAYASCDLSKVLSLVDYNGGTQITQNELDERAEIVEEYQNLEFYIIEGMDTGSYVVYAAYDIKFYNIDTAAPTLTRFYVVTSDDGSIHIYNGEVTAKLNAYLNSVNEYDCVNELSDRIDEELREACRQDETLRALMEILYGYSSDSTQEE